MLPQPLRGIDLAARGHCRLQSSRASHSTLQRPTIEAFSFARTFQTPPRRARSSTPVRSDEHFRLHTGRPRFRARDAANGTRARASIEGLEQQNALAAAIHEHSHQSSRGPRSLLQAFKIVHHHAHRNRTRLFVLIALEPATRNSLKAPPPSILRRNAGILHLRIVSRSRTNSSSER